jgi:hypothetical protein
MERSCRSHAQNRFIFADPLKVVIEYNVAFLEPAMSLERICNDTEDNPWKGTIASEKFEQREGVEQAKIWARIKRAKIPKF